MAQDRDHALFTRLEPGTVIPIRTERAIDVDRRDNRVYVGIVDSDVRGEHGRIAIPRGASAELIVRAAPDNDLILDLESVVVKGRRFSVRSDPDRVESQRDNSLVGAIVSAISGGQVRGHTVRIPRDSVVTFRLERPMEVGVDDHGVTRDGFHYHDWYDRDR